MREWSKDEVWAEGNPMLGPAKPHGVVTVEKDWWLSQGPQLNSQIVERHWFRPGTVRSFQSNVTHEEQLTRETVIPGVKQINIERSIDTDAASATITVNNQRILPPGEVAPAGTGEGEDARGVAIEGRDPVLGDPGYLSWNRGQTAASRGLWGYDDEQPVVYRRFGSTDLDFAAYSGTIYGATGANDRSYPSGWNHAGTRSTYLDDIGDTSTFTSNLFNYAPGFPTGADERPAESRIGGARAFVAGGESVPDDGRPITGVQVWAMVGHHPAAVDPYMTQVLWRACLRMWDPAYGEGDPAEGGVEDPNPGAPRICLSTVYTTSAQTTRDFYLSSDVYGTNPVTGAAWTYDQVNALLDGHNLYNGDLTEGFGVHCVPNAGFNIKNDGTGNPGVPTGDPNPAFHIDELRIYSIWIEVRIGAPEDSWAAALVPNALLRTYQGYGDTGGGLADNLAEGNIIQTGTWLIDRVSQKSNGELELQCRDMAKLLINQRIYPPLIQASSYPIIWAYNFADSVPIANRTNSGLGGGIAGSYGPNTYGKTDPDLTDATVQDVSGNFRDWSEIIRWLLLWSGWWLDPLIDTPSDDFPYSLAGAVKFPVVYGNIENTNSHPSEDSPPVDQSIFDTQPVINAITRIKEFVGYLFRIDCEGAARFEPPNFWTTGNFLDDGTFVPPDEKMYVVDEEKLLIDYGVTYSDDPIRTEIIISSYEPTQPLDDTVTTHYLTPNRDLLRGMIRPFPWTNDVFTSTEDQRRMAELVAVHFWFAQRQGAVSCPANPAIDIDDQILVFERTTSETTVQYVRGLSTNMNLESGDYKMQITTNWMGTPEEWQAVADFILSPEIAEWLNLTDSTINRVNADDDGAVTVDGKVTRGGGFETLAG